MPLKATPSGCGPGLSPSSSLSDSRSYHAFPFSFPRFARDATFSAVVVPVFFDPLASRPPKKHSIFSVPRFLSEVFLRVPAPLDGTKGQSLFCRHRPHPTARHGFLFFELLPSTPRSVFPPALPARGRSPPRCRILRSVNGGFPYAVRQSHIAPPRLPARRLSPLSSSGRFASYERRLLHPAGATRPFF